MSKVDQISLRKKLALDLHRKFVQNARKLHELNYIFWECTLRCNLKCLHCGSDCKMTDIVSDMPVSDFLSTIDHTIDIVKPKKTMIVFTGGEPLLRKDLEICGKELYDRKFPWGIVTNALLLDEKRLKSLTQSGIRAITISLDGLKDNHTWLRGNIYSFQQVISAIRLMQQYPDVVLDVVTCVNKRNFLELDEIKDLLIDLKVKNWRILSISPIGRGNSHPDLQLSPIQFKSLFEYIKANRKDNKNFKLNYGCQGFLGNYEGEVRDNFFFCRAGINIASILSDGSISACPNIRHNYVQGNIYTDRFRDIWENKYEIFRNRNWTKTGLCAECNFYKYCEGNGMHLHDKEGKLLFCHYHHILEGEPVIQYF